MARDPSASDSWIKIIAKYSPQNKEGPYLIPDLTYNILSL